MMDTYTIVPLVEDTSSLPIVTVSKAAVSAFTVQTHSHAEEAEDDFVDLEDFRGSDAPQVLQVATVSR